MTRKVNAAQRDARRQRVAVNLLAAGGCGLLDVFGLDADAVTEQLQAHNSARNRAR
jgi:hypothetical protein